MNRLGHIVFSGCMAALFVLISVFYGWGLYDFTFGFILSFMGIIIVYSLLPDIDHKNGTMTWWILGLGIIGVSLGTLQLVFLVGSPMITLVISSLLLIVTFLAANLKHRGIIHTVWAGMLFSVPLYFIFGSIPHAALGYIAYHSHMWADGLFFKVK